MNKHVTVAKLELHTTEFDRVRAENVDLRKRLENLREAGERLATFAENIAETHGWNETAALANWRKVVER